MSRREEAVTGGADGGVIEITMRRRPAGRRWNRRGLLFDATARFGDLRFVVEGVRSPIVAAVRAVVDGTPDFTDCPWRMVRDGRVDLTGGSARKMAGLRFEEGGRSVHARPEKPGLCADFAPSAPSMAEDT
jgi:hypothetical protein